MLRLLFVLSWFSFHPVLLFAKWQETSQSKSTNCLQTLAAFDIGSGSIKVKVAKVDVCLQKIEEVLHDDSLRIPFSKDLSRPNSDGNFSEQIMKTGEGAIKELKDSAMKKWKVSSFSGVATAAFREESSKNGKKFIAHLAQSLDLNLKVVDQREEAKIGFVAATNASGLPMNQIVAWDIGSGSMQITFQNSKKEFEFYQGDLAAVPMQNYIIEGLQKKPSDTKSPNPIGLENAMKAFAYGKKKAIEPKLAGALIEKLKNPNVQVIGVGPLHYYSMRQQSKKDDGYTPEDLKKTFRTKAVMNDKQVGGKYADTDVSNLILVSAYMEALGVKKVIPKDINLSDGVLVMPDYWPNIEKKTAH